MNESERKYSVNDRLSTYRCYILFSYSIVSIPEAVLDHLESPTSFNSLARPTEYAWFPGYICEPGVEMEITSWLISRPKSSKGAS